MDITLMDCKQCGHPHWLALEDVLCTTCRAIQRFQRKRRRLEKQHKAALDACWLGVGRER